MFRLYGAHLYIHKLTHSFPTRRSSDLQDVLRQVDHHRTRTAGGGDVERLVHDPGEVVRILHQVVVLGAGPGDAGGVGFLEGVVADQVRRHLAGQAHDRNRVHQRVGEPGDRVGRTRTRGDQHHADLAGRPGIALGGVHRRLLVAHQDVPDGVGLEELVVDRQYRPAGIAEYDFYALVLQRLEDDRCARHRRWRRRATGG